MKPALGLAAALAIALLPARAAAQGEHDEGGAVDPARLAAAVASYGHEPTVARVVEAALAVAELDPEQAARAARRARRAGWLPQLRVGARRGTGRDESATQSGSGDRLDYSTDADLTLEASLTFHLDQVVYGPDEVSWAREQRTRASHRRDLMRYVVHLYFERRRLLLERDLLGLRDLDHTLRIAEVEAMLDAFTDGAFSRMMASP